MKAATKAKSDAGGKLRIGDDWNAITIIALSQNNPLKAVAEFVENSIDAHASHVVITRGREQGMHYLRIFDDGDGIPRDAAGAPNFKYVATHICDSVKRRLKERGIAGVQGEFGIGLLSFWTVGEALKVTSSSADGAAHEMRMNKGDPNYAVSRRRTLFAPYGTELLIKPLLPGIRQLSGEKIQRYLASELRDRIRHSGVEIKVVDRQARREYKVEPRQFNGRLLHDLPPVKSSYGEIYLELYLTQQGTGNHVGLYRSGTRVLEDIARLEGFGEAPWNLGYLQGIADVNFLNLTPGTRAGIVHDQAFAEMLTVFQPLGAALMLIIDEQQKAEEERSSREVLKAIQKAFTEALLVLPAEDYDWFDIRKPAASGKRASIDGENGAAIETAGNDPAGGAAPEQTGQRQFFDYAGPLFNVKIAPASCIVSVGKTRTLRAVPRDRTRHLVEDNLTFAWDLVEGGGVLQNTAGEIVTFIAPDEPGLNTIRVTVTQGPTDCEATGLITVTDSLLPENKTGGANKHGLPGYTFHSAPGELWRSRYDAQQNVIVINNGHRDFVYAARVKALKLRYISRLFAKEMVIRNFPGLPSDQVLERMIELSLYTEENLK